uniref:Zgc:109986 n=1 Tax=Cyprinodon variegatus TaxID=28743 RepID=A0A3Q2CKF9_CYPVA
MNFGDARLKLRELLGSVDPAELPKLLDWMRNSDELDELLVDNNRVILQSIAADLRARLPVHAMLPSETAAQHKMRERPTVHVDGFLYSEEQVDALCEEGAMSREYCLSCGSLRTAPLDFISHSFSVSELQFLFQNVLPDLSGRTVVDVGSRLGAVLYGVSFNICKHQRSRQSSDKSRVVQSSAQDDPDASLIIAFHACCARFNSEWNYFELIELIHSSRCETEHSEFPTLGWVEELPVDYSVYLGRDTDPEDLRQIHLYRVI